MFLLRRLTKNQYCEEPPRYTVCSNSESGARKAVMSSLFIFDASPTLEQHWVIASRLLGFPRGSPHPMWPGTFVHFCAPQLFEQLFCKLLLWMTSNHCHILYINDSFWHMFIPTFLSFTPLHHDQDMCQYLVIWLSRLSTAPIITDAFPHIISRQ